MEEKKDNKVEKKEGREGRKEERMRVWKDRGNEGKEKKI